ncbi:MAG: glutathione-dependent formaldehyde dehydrogenase [Ignavibacteria bacterium]|nr:glutathione-dependent formaldehyde dehydrogenase [Ignavibacteria bacterium]MCU7504012.1 glutathione-dependent formaldehyde dehydrogenase [Ignavibacteria bacterium]MCU7515384.1 glutathione-dependent formaldehyde dehydrogenase [Ignavibacteria bacterium]
MKAVVFHGIGDIRLEEVKEPKIKDTHDAIVKITSCAICGTDLHLVRGTMAGMKPGTIIGHEGIGIVEEAGKEVRNLKAGDRVIIPSTIACGYCSYCRAGYFSQCDNANPMGKNAGTSFFGGPLMSGAFNGLQAEKARVPFANAGLVKIPEDVTDDDAILLSDIFPTGYFAAEMAEIKHGDTVAVFGCGPVGQFAIISAFLLGAGRVLAVDRITSRLEMARTLGAEVINFDDEDPVEVIHELTGGIGVDRTIDAVGVDAMQPEKGPALKKSRKLDSQFRKEVDQVAPRINPHGKNWIPGNGPSQALLWQTEAIAKAGTMSVIGVYPQTFQSFPFGMIMNKNLTIKAGNCNHRKYIPMLLEMVQGGVVSPKSIITQVGNLDSIIKAYKAFDERQPGWLKVEILASEEHDMKRQKHLEEVTAQNGKSFVHNF